MNNLVVIVVLFGYLLGFATSTLLFNQVDINIQPRIPAGMVRGDANDKAN